MPATPSVNAFSAEVTAKVRLKMRIDSAFTVAWSATLRSSSAELLLQSPRSSRGSCLVARSGPSASAASAETAGSARATLTRQLALGIAVIGVDADDVELPGAARRRHLDDVADADVQPAAQLLADEGGIARHELGPGVAARSPAAASVRDRARDRAGRATPPAALRACVSARPPERIAWTSRRSRSRARIATACVHCRSALM